MATNKPAEPQATTGFVRLIGAFELIGGALMYYTGADWYIDGLVAPRAFRQRASRFYKKP